MINVLLFSFFLIWLIHALLSGIALYNHRYATLCPLVYAEFLLRFGCGVAGSAAVYVPETWQLLLFILSALCAMGSTVSRMIQIRYSQFK